MKSIKIFKSKKIRSSWDNEQGKWYFSIVDIIEELTDSPRPRKYWSALKSKLQNEGSELSHKLGHSPCGKIGSLTQFITEWEFS